MSFFKTSDNQQIKSDGKFESGGGSFEPIPDGTSALAIIDEGKWDSYEGDEYISLRWEIIDGEYKGRKIFHKLKVDDFDVKKKDKALRMLAAIDTNCGGNLQKLDRKPDDADFAMSLLNKPQWLKLGVWEINNKRGNWVMAVAPRTGGSTRPAPTETPTATPPAFVEDFHDDIPFN